MLVILSYWPIKGKEIALKMVQQSHLFFLKPKPMNMQHNFTRITIY